jgi:hypothetical protein
MEGFVVDLFRFEKQPCRKEVPENDSFENHNLLVEKDSLFTQDDNSFSEEDNRFAFVKYCTGDYSS